MFLGTNISQQQDIESYEFEWSDRSVSEIKGQSAILDLVSNHTSWLTKQNEHNLENRIRTNPRPPFISHDCLDDTMGSYDLDLEALALEVTQLKRKNEILEAENKRLHQLTY